MILWVFSWWLHDWKGKMGTTGGRENISSRVHRLVKFILFIIHLNDFLHIILFWFLVKYKCYCLLAEEPLVLEIYIFHENDFNIKSLCLLREGLLVFNVHMRSMRKGFCNLFLEEYLVSFKMYGDSKKYIYFVRYGVCKIN